MVATIYETSDSIKQKPKLCYIITRVLCLLQKYMNPVLGFLRLLTKTVIIIHNYLFDLILLLLHHIIFHISYIFVCNNYRYFQTSQFTVTHTRVLSLLQTPTIVLTTDYNTETLRCSLDYTLQMSHIKSSLHTRAFNSALLQLTNCPIPSRFLCCCAIVTFVSVATGMCLPNRCPETALVYPPISQ
jgi:hypothetical protein